MTPDDSMSKPEPKPEPEPEPAASRRPRTRTVRHAVAWSYAMSWAQQLASIAVFLILARLLAPAQFGVLAIAMVLIAFLQLFVEQGLTIALVRRKALDDAHLNAAFWVTLASSLLLGTGAFAIAGWWGRLYALPELASVVRALALLPVLLGLSVVQAALLQRAMAFRTLAVRTTVAVTLGGLVGILLALLGFGVWALVAQHLVSAAAGLVVLWLASPWRPGFTTTRRHALELLGFSGRTLLEALGYFTGARTATLVIGFAFGPGPAGIYSLATRLVELLQEALSRPLSKVALPRFGQVQDEPEKLRTAVLAFVTLSGAVVAPAMAALAVSSGAITELLSDRWRPAAMPIKFLALAGLVAAITRFTGPLLHALGRPALQAGLVWLFGFANVVGFIIAAALLGPARAPVAAAAMAAVYAIVTILLAPVCFRLVAKPLGLTTRDAVRALRPTLVAAGLALLVGLTIHLIPGVRSAHAFWRLLALAGSSALVGYAAAYALDPALRRYAREILTRLRRRPTAAAIAETEPILMTSDPMPVSDNDLPEPIPLDADPAPVAADTASYASEPRRRWRTPMLAGGFVILLLALGYAWYATRPLLEVRHAPDRYSARTNDFTANITGHTFRLATHLRYRINDGEWRPLPRSEPRVPVPAFTLEMGADELRPGENRVTIASSAPLRAPARWSHRFEYDPSPPTLPVRIDWGDFLGRDAQLDAQDGSWEVFISEFGPRVRPVPGQEGYDRVLAVTGAFDGARRVETDVVFRHDTAEGRLWGFGVLGMWGGWPDAEAVRPRRGWSYAVQWYYSRYEGVGVEFSHKDGGAPFAIATSFMGFTPEPGVRYRVVAELWPIMPDASRADDGVRYQQRMQWWRDGEPEPAAWVELGDAPGSPMPAGPYAVGLLVHRAQADFGPVTVTPIPHKHP